MKSKKLNLGCGNKKYPNFINIDINPKTHPDVVRDIEQGLPFDNDSIDFINTEHCLEHINVDQFYFVIYEIWRVLKPNCQVRIVVPIGKGWMNSPEHKTHFAEYSDVFLTKWNNIENTGFHFILVNKEIKKENVNDLGSNTEEFGAELIMILEAIK